MVQCGDGVARFTVERKTESQPRTRVMSFCDRVTSEIDTISLTVHVRTVGIAQSTEQNIATSHLSI